MQAQDTIFDIQSKDLGQHRGKHIGHSDWETLLTIANWQVSAGQHWAVVGGSDAQRSAICSFLREELAKTTLNYSEISPAAQEQVIAEEIRRSQTGIADEINTGTRVKDFLNIQSDTESCTVSQLVKTLELGHCLNKHFRDLSSGETRRALIIRSLSSKRNFYLMQDPYEGLDHQTRPIARELIEKSLTTSVFVASRSEQLPAKATHLAYIENDQLVCKALTEPLEKALETIKQIIEPAEIVAIPDLPKDHPYHKTDALGPNAALVKMRQVTVAYAEQEKPIFENIDFEIHPFQHCQITGRNGAGKSTLLKLITGDHPQVYNNDIEVCGFRRGAGESVWEVKRHIGYMGGEMLWNYRSSGQLAGKTLNVVISGLHDSIGLYTTANTADKTCARAWLEIFEMGESANKRFNKLSMAEQRLALIARALIKRPALLILDEPCQGLDSVDRRRVLSVIEKLITARACTVLYVSHHDDEKIAGVHSQFSMDD